MPKIVTSGCAVKCDAGSRMWRQRKEMLFRAMLTYTVQYIYVYVCMSIVNFMLNCDVLVSMQIHVVTCDGANPMRPNLKNKITVKGASLSVQIFLVTHVAKLRPDFWKRPQVLTSSDAAEFLNNRERSNVMPLTSRETLRSSQNAAKRDVVIVTARHRAIRVARFLFI
jgi:hypothetical protein